MKADQALLVLPFDITNCLVCNPITIHGHPVGATALFRFGGKNTYHHGTQYGEGERCRRPEVWMPW
jgi:hypothetical protein